MPRGKPSPKLAITIDTEVHEEVLAASARHGVSVAAWTTNAAREALQRRASLAVALDWGSFSEKRWMKLAETYVHSYEQ